MQTLTVTTAPADVAAAIFSLSSAELEALGVAVARARRVRFDPALEQLARVIARACAARVIH